MHKCKKHPCPKPETCKCRTVREANVPIIWLLGGAGTGKETIGNALHELFGFDYLSVGSLLRDESKLGGRKAAAYERAIAAGKLIGDDEVVELLERRMRSLLKQSRGYVVSFAKNVAQAEQFEKYIAPADLVLLLQCSDETMMARSKARAAAAGVAMESDDVEEVMKVRIEQFHATLEAIQRRMEPKLTVVDVEAGEEEVMARIEPLVRAVTARKLAETPKPTCDPEEAAEVEAEPKRASK